MIITNNIAFNGYSQKTNNKTQHQLPSHPVNFTGKTGLTGGQVLVGTVSLGALGIAGAKSKSIVKFFKNVFKTNSKKVSDEVHLMDVSDFAGVDLEASFKKKFHTFCIERIKNPFRNKINKEGKPERIIGSFPPNGYMLTGPKSEAREERFNWMIDELKKAGAEIIDPSDGKQSKYPALSDAWWDMWKHNNDEEFKKNGKFRVFVVRGLDEIGQPEGYPEGWFKFPDGCLLKDSPDSNNCCERHGIMLLYSCTDTTKVDPAVIRFGRIDINNCPQPKDNEPLSIWKDYLKEIKTYHPSVVVNKLAAAREVLSKKGDEVMNEMEPHFAYSIPYVVPKATDSIKKWQNFIIKNSENVDSWKANKYLMLGLDKLEGNLDIQNNPAHKEKYETIYKMMEDIQKPEDLALWKKYMKCREDNIDIAYVD